MRHSRTAKRQIHHVDSCAHRAQGWTRKGGSPHKGPALRSGPKTEEPELESRGRITSFGFEDEMRCLLSEINEIRIFPLTAIM